MDGMSDTPAVFIDRISQTIKAHRMICPGSRVLIGFSGGPDSIALVRVLMTLAHRLDITIGLAHLNHGLRGKASDQDEAFVREFARAHAIDLDVTRVDVKTLAKEGKHSLETAGRIARYTFFKEVSQKKVYHFTALGHHRDDHTEQVLLNLIRGSGPSGLKGIAPKREGGIIRPLIRVSKSEILAYLEAIPAHSFS